MTPPRARRLVRWGVLPLALGCMAAIGDQCVPIPHHAFYVGWTYIYDPQPIWLAAQVPGCFPVPVLDELWEVAQSNVYQTGTPDQVTAPPGQPLITSYGAQIHIAGDTTARPYYHGWMEVRPQFDSQTGLLKHYQYWPHAWELQDATCLSGAGVCSGVFLDMEEATPRTGAFLLSAGWFNWSTGKDCRNWWRVALVCYDPLYCLVPYSSIEVCPGCLP